MIPFSRMELASSSSASSAKLRRGWSGLGVIRSIAMTCSARGADGRRDGGADICHQGREAAAQSAAVRSSVRHGRAHLML
jgi:hypothetical protein